MSFYAVLPSNGCPDTQPDNEANSYIIEWETPTDLTGKWEVALTEFSFNYIAPRIAKPSKIEYLTVQPKRNVVEFIIKDGIFVSMVGKLFTVTLVDDKISFKCDKSPFSLKFKNIEEAYIFGSAIEVTSNSKELIFENSIVTDKDVEIEVEVFYAEYHDVRLTKEFRNYPKFTNIQQMTEYYSKNGNTIFEEFSYDYYGHIYFKIKQEIKQIMLDGYLMYSLGFEDTYIFNNQYGAVFKAKKTPTFESAFHQYYIYSSIVDPIMVGGTRVPLLRSVWVGSNHMAGDVIHENIDYPMYLPVSSESVKSIEIEIRDDGGNLIDFPYGSKTSMTLHFVYKQNQK